MSSTTTCIPNIGPRQRRLRLNFGLVFLGLGVVMGLGLAWLDQPRMWRLAGFVPLWMGGVSVMQAYEKTCVALQKRGMRDMDSGPEPITEDATLRQLAIQARKVQIRGLALAVALS